MSSDADEVAEDYRHALEDLSTNMRFEISNLTVIARENTEHSLTIAEVLQEHILKAPPAKKLPALYVLDSIVKNVGTPYTLYFGRNLFKIFMESYAVVDTPVRRKMEEMLRTWKDPVPGSMDLRPVFSHELVRPIENALMKARAATMVQQGSLPGRPRSAMPPHRDTPTPPGMSGTPVAGGYYPPQAQQHPNGARVGEHPPVQGQYLGQPQPPYYTQTTPQPYGTAQGPYQAPPHGQYGQVGAPGLAGISVETLQSDIQNLVIATNNESLQKPHDASVQGRLRALLELQGVLQRTSLPPDQLELIKNKVTELASVTTRPAPTPIPSTAASGLVPQLYPGHSASVTPTPAPASQPAASVTLDSLLGAGALAALMAKTSSKSQNSTPVPLHGGHVLRSPPPAVAELPKPPVPAQNDAMSLLERLRSAGMLPPSNSTNHTVESKLPPAQPPAQPPAPVIPPNIASILSQARAANIGSSFSPVAADTFNVTALKQQFRPDAVRRIYDDLGIACTQCGRRFRTDEEGRRKKMAHMDWHFKVHQRSAEAEKRGTHRSWYVDQQDWLKSREVVDSDHVAATETNSAEASKEGEPLKYIPVPDSSSGINTVCPICQEKFENKWLDTAQEWVWLDAILVRNRAYHASCIAEASRDREITPGLSRPTPEPVLGKRKAEANISSPKVRALKTST